MRFSGVGVLEDVEALGVSGHEAVLDAVVNHFYEMAAARGAAVEIAFLGGAADFFAPRSARNIAAAGRECFENGIEILDDIFFAANHLAVAALEAPNAAAGANVAVVNSFSAELL